MRAKLNCVDIGESRERIRIGGIGGCHGASNYERPSRDLQGWAKRHFTHDECERLSGHGGLELRREVDELLANDWSRGRGGHPKKPSRTRSR